VGGYQQYIEKLAAAGVPQDRLREISENLRAEFMKQGEELGYSRDDLNRYAVAFDDVKTAIDRVPRNITVKANTNPALQALAELDAKAKALSDKTFSGPTWRPSASELKKARKFELEAKIAGFRASIAAHTPRQNFFSSDISSLAYYAKKLSSGSYRQGGYTGNKPPWEEAGTVHGREFVLNQQGTSMFPRQVLDAANQGRQVNFGRQQAAAPKFPSRMIVELSPIDRDLMAQGGQVTVVLGADVIGQSASSSFASDDRRGAS